MENLTNEQIHTSQEAVVSGKKILTWAIVLSVIFGIFGGAVGALFVVRNPNVLKILVSAPTVQNQKISVAEDSAIIDIYKQQGPAVVSIIISQNVSKIPGYGASPLGNDPFFNFFFNNGSGNAQQTPNNGGLQEIGAGSGFFISADGLIVTNKHVVSDETASYTVLTQDGKKYDAKVLSRDPVNDLAIVKIDIQKAPFLHLADSLKLQVGQRVIAIGNSLGQYQNTVTSGIVSGIGRKIEAGDETGSSESLSNVIQTDAAINPGNSGGPLLDIMGNVVGINTAIDQQGQLVGFAIPSNEINKAVSSFRKNGKITRAYLGVRYIILTADIATQEKLPKDYGALIVRGQTRNDLAVIPGSPADKAGLIENDIIEEVNGTKVDQDHTLSDLLNQFNVSDSVTLKIYDKGNEKTIKVILGETK